MDRSKHRRVHGGGGGFTVANEPPRSFKFRFKINAQRHMSHARSLRASTFSRRSIPRPGPVSSHAHATFIQLSSI